MKVEELAKNLNTWAAQDIVEPRLKNDEAGRVWIYKTIGYDKPLTLLDYQQFFDRTDANNEYEKRYNTVDIPSRKPYSWYQTEVNFIYSFHKCFANRNFTRLQYYRNDMSQKAKRVLTAVNQTLGKYMKLRDASEEAQKG